MMKMGEVQDALKKQEPMKPFMEDVSYGFYTCTSCDGEIRYSGDYKNHKYCLLCGQKFDWR